MVFSRFRIVERRSAANASDSAHARRQPPSAVALLVLVLVMLHGAHASDFPAELGLSSLNGINGFKIDGEGFSDESGYSVSSAGDVNGDGVDDLIIGAQQPNPNQPGSGRSYVVFGSVDGFVSALQISMLDGNNGFKLVGEADGDRAGFSVAGAGDVNGDGIDDLVIGAPNASPNGNRSGRSYVVFGTTEGFASPFDLRRLDGANGFKIDGEAGDRSGAAVSGAGDVNGDGVDDLIIGAPQNTSGNETPGRSYVVFGSTEGFASPFQLSTLDGAHGFRIDGENAFDRAGFSVGAAGDVDNDGVDDLIIGAPFHSPDEFTRAFAGRSYIVFGRTDGFPGTVQLFALNGFRGFKIDGVAEFDFSGHSVSAAGDFNADGIDDLIVGSDPDPANAVDTDGKAYVVFGRDTSSQLFPEIVLLADLDGSDGVKLVDRQDGNGLGHSVGGAGDVNGDGIDDVIVGAPNRRFGTDFGVGAGFLVFGRNAIAEPFPASIQVTRLDGSDGVELFGERAGDNSGFSVGLAGDVNGDGVSDLIVGAPRADPNDSSSGRSHVVFGRAAPPLIATAPVGLSAELSPGQSETLDLEVSNQGVLRLDWQFNQVAAARISHSTSMSILSGHSIVCPDGNGTGTHESRYLRKFELPEFGMEDDLVVTGVTFGIEQLTHTSLIEVNLYTLDGAFHVSNLTEIGSAVEEVPDQFQTLVEIPVIGTVPAGATLVVEIRGPDGSFLGESFAPGMNAAGETDPSYMVSEQCGIFNPTTMGELGFPDRHLVMEIESADCGLSSWANMELVSGSLFEGESELVAVEFDASGLGPGNFVSNLCIQSNDTSQPLTMVPLSLAVTEAVEVDISPSSINFGDHPPGVEAPARGVVIENQGPGDLTLGTLMFEGAGASDYTLTFDGCSDRILMSGESCSIDVGFAASTTGVRAARLRVPSNALGSPHFVDVSGSSGVLFFDGFEN